MTINTEVLKPDIKEVLSFTLQLLKVLSIVFIRDFLMSQCANFHSYPF